MGRQNSHDRHRRRAVDRDYRTSWILREVYGAPVWGMMAAALVIIGVLVLYLSTR
ncbi:MAG: hypothetical protein JST25_13180 [Actinobacteria bacterium]|nr:hypothetical protein [Actinomycetota bacterium]